MSHTIKVQIDNDFYYVHHNSDWSGHAAIVGPSRTEAVGTSLREINIPGKVLLAIGRAAALEEFRSKLIQFAEDME